MKHPLSTQQALETFLRGFSATRSFHHPFPIRQLSPALWLLADADSARTDGRRPEVIAYHSSPEEVQETCQNLGLGRHALCVLLDEAGTAPEAVAAYKRVGYRLLGREPLFTLDVAERIRFNTVAVRRVTHSADAAAVAKAARSRQLFPPHLTDEDALCRLYAAFEGETTLGWVRSIRTHPDCAWVSNLYVQTPYRRAGIGRTLMSAMLDDDARYGVEWSVLTASLTGAKLYPHLGYKERGLLLVFSPLARSEEDSDERRN